VIRFSDLTAGELAQLAAPPFAGFRAAQVPSDWRILLAHRPGALRSDGEAAMPSGKRMERKG
jgi:hypothetical protein